MTQISDLFLNHLHVLNVPFCNQTPKVRHKLHTKAYLCLKSYPRRNLVIQVLIRNQSCSSFAADFCQTKFHFTERFSNMSKPQAAGVWYRLEKPFPCVTWRQHSVQQVSWIQADVVENVIKRIYFFFWGWWFCIALEQKCQ